jgi:monovalent cation/hydrogen antiporter
MSGFHVVLVLLVVVGVLAPVARKIDVPDLIVFVLGGIGLSLVPALGAFEFNPDVVFLIFVPPMLYRAASDTSVRTLRRNGRSILSLAVGLVLATTAAVAIVAHELGMGWAPACVLGAVVSPPDAIVATSIARRLGVPKRLVAVLEGESLMNDTTAFVA